ncbi:glycosyl transferase [Microbacterium nanhaiense]|uniref:Glycosyl transferase n=1 Tax=Microbacterium nanhaiense TaxID=1301026 RepID=A0ABQ2N4M8_9MICO|nr:glycosyltransferase [Microbacterium nanhaiense]GGO66816.1 glycosyl transferase [Microbacterium nanhaiense]
MKISMVSEHASPLAAPGSVDAGGQNVHVAALSLALARRGHEVTVFTRRDDPELPTSVPLGDGVEVVHVDAGPAARVPKDELLPHMDELARGIAAVWAEDPPEVVHAHFWMSGVASLAAAALGVSPAPPVLQTFHALGTVKRRHQGAADTSPAARAWLEPHVARTVTGVIASCSDEAFELRSMGVPSQNISIAPCGVDVTAFSPDGPVEPRGLAHRIVSIGRLVPRKGVDLVILALGILAAQGRDDIELVVAGSAEGPAARDPEIARLRQIARGCGVEDRVIFRGPVARESVPALLRSADAVVCAPWYEPFGIVPLEAMACGVPVVAAAVGGLIDTVIDGITGMHVPPRDAQAIADALGAILADDRVRDRMGRAGRERVEARYTWDRVAAQVEHAYLEALASGAHAAQAAGPATEWALR